MHELEHGRARLGGIPTKRNARNMQMSRIAGNYLLRRALACALPFLGIAMTRAGDGQGGEMNPVASA